MTPHLYACPVCGYLTRREESLGTYDVCPVCFWEDDPVQGADPNRSGGANHVSLNEAKRNFASFGASEERHQHHVRAPLPQERPA